MLLTGSLVLLVLSSISQQRADNLDDPRLLELILSTDEMSSIRSRESVKRQQELVVEEIYNLEQKDVVESKLEAIRKEKLSLTQAPKQSELLTQSEKLNPMEGKTVVGAEVVN